MLKLDAARRGFFFGRLFFSVYIYRKTQHRPNKHQIWPSPFFKKISLFSTFHELPHVGNQSPRMYRSVTNRLDVNQFFDLSPFLMQYSEQRGFYCFWGIKMTNVKMCHSSATPLSERLSFFEGTDNHCNHWSTPCLYNLQPRTESPSMLQLMCKRIEQISDGSFLVDVMFELILNGESTDQFVKFKLQPDYCEVGDWYELTAHDFASAQGQGINSSLIASLN